MQTIIAMIIAYLLGSISSSIIICKLTHQPDPRTQGSGNAGATNMLRFAGKKLAAATLAGDLLKGVLAVLIGRLLQVHGLELSIVAFAALVGHVYPIFFKFKGGKGVATMLGTILALAPMIGLFTIATWLIIAVVFRYSSLAAMVAGVLAPFYMVFDKPVYVFGLVLMALLLLWKHRENIKRLRAGNENKIGKSKKTQE